VLAGELCVLFRLGVLMGVVALVVA